MTLARQKIQFRNFIKTWQIYVDSCEKRPYLPTESFKVKNDLSSEIMMGIFVFQENETYDLRSGNQLARKNIRTTQYGIESVWNLGAKLWKLLPIEINSSSLTVLKNEIRKWTPEKNSCKLCQTHKKCWLHLISLRHLLGLHLYFDLKFKSLWECYGIEILSHQQILI